MLKNQHWDTYSRSDYYSANHSLPCYLYKRTTSCSTDICLGQVTALAEAVWVDVQWACSEPRLWVIWEILHALCRPLITAFRNSWPIHTAPLAASQNGMHKADHPSWPAISNLKQLPQPKLRHLNNAYHCMSLPHVGGCKLLPWQELILDIVFLLLN